MKIGILVTKTENFNKIEHYYSQEVGLARELDARGHEVTVYKCIPKTNHYMKSRNFNFCIHYYPSFHLGIHGYFNCKNLSKNLDCLIVFSDKQIFMPHIFRFCNKNNIICVPYIELTHSKKLRAKIADFLFKIGTLKYYKTTEVVAKSEFIKNELKEMGIDEVSVAPVGIDKQKMNLTFRNRDRNEIRKEYNYRSLDKIILFTGNEQEKMVKLFRKVHNVNHNTRLLIIGETEIKTFIKQIKLQDYVQVIKPRHHESMWKIHYMVDDYIDLSRDETFNKTMMEAIVYDTRVIAYYSTAHDTILSDLQGHFLCNDAREAYEFLLKKADTYLLQQSSNKMLEIFDWKTMSEIIEKIIKKRHTHNNNTETDLVDFDEDFLY